MMARVIVIGGGIIGVSTAYRLAQAGAEVTLLEAGRLAGGTSSTTFAWMNSNNKGPLEYHQLNVAGMSEHHLLREEFGSAPWLHVHGNIIWTDERIRPADAEPDVPIVAEPVDTKIERLTSWGYPIEVLSPDELSGIHPDIQPPADLDRILFFPTEGYIDVPDLVARLAREAKRHGATILTGKEVIGINTKSGRVTGVETATGDTFEADVVVSCAGRWTDTVTAMTGVELPMAPTLGLLAITSPMAHNLRALAHTPRVNVRPEGGSRVIMASFDLDRTLTSDMSHSTLSTIAEQILERATEIMPALHGGRVESYRLGIRAIPKDGFPMVGPIDGLDGFYTISTHSGVTMGPVLGRIAAKEILSGEPDSRVAPFRPDRLRERIPVPS